MKIVLNKDFFLRPLCELDVDGNYPLWFNDLLVTKYSSHGKFFKSKNFFKKYILELDEEKNLVLAIMHKRKHIGNISLQNISFLDQNAELAIILGEKKYWGKGVGLKASIEICRHGFKNLNLKKIYCGTAKNNKGMNSIAKKLGMKIEGVRKNHLFLNNKFEDLLEYSIFKKEFLKINY